MDWQETGPPKLRLSLLAFLIEHLPVPHLELFTFPGKARLVSETEVERVVTLGGRFGQKAQKLVTGHDGAVNHVQDLKLAVM